MRKILRDLLQGKYAIGYTLQTMANMVPREIRWLRKLPVLGNMFTGVQFFWFLTKIIFFTTVISWFKPQYHHAGAKVFLFLITFGLLFFAGRMFKKEFDRREVLK